MCGAKILLKQSIEPLEVKRNLRAQSNRGERRVGTDEMVMREEKEGEAVAPRAEMELCLKAQLLGFKRTSTMTTGA